MLANILAACAAAPAVAPVAGTYTLDEQKLAKAMKASVDAYVASIPESERVAARRQLGRLHMKRTVVLQLRANGNYHLESDIGGVSMTDEGSWSLNNGRVQLTSSNNRPSSQFEYRDGRLLTLPDHPRRRFSVAPDLARAIELERIGNTR